MQSVYHFVAKISLLLKTQRPFLIILPMRSATAAAIDIGGTKRLKDTRRRGSQTGVYCISNIFS